MKHLKTYKLFESVGGYLTDILLEINDENLWKAECWSESQTGKWVIVIKTEFSDLDEENWTEVQTPPPIVIETVERSIDFMNGEGFTNYQITFENTDDIYKGGSAEFEEINLEEVSDLDVWPNNFIRIEFWR
jgi:hypothetical protein